MPGFRNVRDLVDAELTGATTGYSFRKVPALTTGAGIWFDLSMSPGSPTPQYYIGAQNAFSPLTYNTDVGLNVGQPVLPKYKFLRRATVIEVTGGLPMTMILMDYIGFYGFIDEGVPLTTLTNVNRTTSTRHFTDARGVQIMPVVVAQHSGISLDTFYVTYTNSAGVQGRTSASVPLTTQIVNGTILSSTGRDSTRSINSTPFIPLQEGDEGVQKIDSVVFPSATDYGLFALVLVKPLATVVVRGVDAPTDVDFLKDFSLCPRLLDDAYLNWLVCPNGTLAATPIFGLLETVAL